ncbi:MAG: beta-glucosidase [Caldithrix sp.]|nr:beta-glucosidase [Caldithrix sp.]
MKMIKIWTMHVMLFVFLVVGQLVNASTPEEEMETNIQNLLQKMTVEEKVGQMTQITLGVVSKERGDELFVNQLDMDKLKEAVLKYHIGSFLNTNGMANTLENWHEMITTMQDIATKETRLGIPIIYGIDAIHGVNYTKDATLFPQSIAMAATRNLDLVREEGRITALECRASGLPWNFNPVLGVGREPLWPRFWETYGEDLYLTCELGRAYIEGQQGNDMSQKDRVATCMKHYLGYSIPLNGQDRTPAWIPERMLREIFLPPFKDAVEAGSPTVMVNSGEINGIPVHSSHYLLTDILKKELGFKGFIVSDWEDVKRLYDRDRVATSPKEAVRMAVMAGLDMSMVPHDYSFFNYLVELVKEGKVPESRINDAVERILRVKWQVGLFENPYPDASLKSAFATEESGKVCLESAREAITLLKNRDQVLPLDKSKKVFVTGPTANLLSVLNGGWTITWEGKREELYPQEKNTILEAIQSKVGSENVLYEQGCSFEEIIDVQKAVRKARESDYVVLCLGEPTYCESPGNIDDLSLYPAQLEFAKAIYKTGKPVVLVMVEGRPRVITEITQQADGIIMAYLPGMDGGTALADIIFGDVNPSGKLPFSYPRTPNGFTTYDHKPLESFDVNAYNPLYPFGHGLSYTTFAYSELKLNKRTIKKGETIEIAVTVTNSGQRAGKEAVELYVTDLYGSVSRPVKQLKRFTKIDLKPGQSKTMQFTLNEQDLSFIGRELKPVVESGDFEIHIGDQTQSFELVL